MTDRELLELAAKAAGVKKDDSPFNGGGFGNTGFDTSGDMVLDWHNNVRWNPLTDDGDALRLAVKLNLDIRVDTCDGGICVSVFGNYDDAPEPVEEVYEDAESGYVATRRAIVRAAAEIGKAMES